ILGGKDVTQGVSHHPSRAGAAPGRPTDTRRTPRLTDVHARNVRAPGSGGATYGHQSGPFALLRCRQGAGVRGSCRVGHECAIRQGKHALRHHPAWLGHAARIQLEPGRPVSLDWSDYEVPPVCGALSPSEVLRWSLTSVKPAVSFRLEEGWQYPLESFWSPARNDACAGRRVVGRT